MEINIVANQIIILLLYDPAKLWTIHDGQVMESTMPHNKIKKIFSSVVSKGVLLTHKEK